MTLLEAHNTGRSYKRPHERAYGRMSDESNGVFFRSRRLSVEDITADDWELEPKSITVTRDQIIEAIARATNSGQYPVCTSYGLALLLKELGL